MKNRIKENLENFEQLEKMYATDKKTFEKAFFDVYPEISDFSIADFWKTRLEFGISNQDAAKIKMRDVLFLIVSCLVAALLIEIPRFFSFVSEDYMFYQRNAGLIVLFGLSVYAFFARQSIKPGHLLMAVLVFVVSAVFINLLPAGDDRQSVNLAYLHLPLMLWCLYGLIFIDFNTKDKLKRIDYIKYNGDLAVLMAVILIAGGVLTGVTFGLFSAIDLDIEKFYLDYVIFSGLVSVPIVATFIIRFLPVVANKIAPIIASIFSPLVLLTLVVYLVSIVLTGKNPYDDRDFLIVFNLMLLGVMGIIVFSVSETSFYKKQAFNLAILFALSVITLIIDVVALSAILYRLGEYGFTPNRIAVLGSNLLIFGNLVLIMLDLFKVNFKNQDIQKVEMTIATYLPVYALWTVFMVFVMPFIFGFR
ncbi:MAG: hypothetical protein K9H16_00105 [Bacteroidales bacterium]|nr:hypothetical protein [Bacteroidales bacterium]